MEGGGLSMTVNKMTEIGIKEEEVGRRKSDCRLEEARGERVCECGCMFDACKCGCMFVRLRLPTIF